MACGYEAPHFGAFYPDARCIDGYLWDLDSGDGEYLTVGGDTPCPACNVAEYVQCGESGQCFHGNAHQRRIQRRAIQRKVRAWALARSSFPCGATKGTP